MYPGDDVLDFAVPWCRVQMSDDDVRRRQIITINYDNLTENKPTPLLLINIIDRYRMYVCGRIQQIILFCTYATSKQNKLLP